MLSYGSPLSISVRRAASAWSILRFAVSTGCGSDIDFPAFLRPALRFLPDHPGIHSGLSVFQNMSSSPGKRSSRRSGFRTYLISVFADISELATTRLTVPPPVTSYKFLRPVSVQDREDIQWRDKNSLSANLRLFSVSVELGA